MYHNLLSFSNALPLQRFTDESPIVLPYQQYNLVHSLTNGALWRELKGGINMSVNSEKNKIALEKCFSSLSARLKKSSQDLGQERPQKSRVINQGEKPVEKKLFAASDDFSRNYSVR